MKNLLFLLLLIPLISFGQSKRISELDAATSVNGTEILPIVQSSTNKKATISLVAPVRSLGGLSGAMLLATGTSGTDFAISSSGVTHTFNIPSSSGSNRGLLTSADWTTFNNKIGTLNSLTGSSQTFATGTSGTDFAINSSGTTHTFNIPSSSGSNRGMLLSADWTTFNNKIGSLNALTGATQTFATGTTGTDFGISSSGSAHTFNIPDASASNRGLITTGTQSIAGAKTFNALLRTGTSTPIVSGSSLLSTYASSTASGNEYTSTSDFTQSAATTGGRFATYSYAKATHTTGTVASLYGIVGHAQSSAAGTTTNLTASYNSVSAIGNSPVTNATGGHFFGVDIISGTSVVTNSYGVKIGASVPGAGTITNRWGLYSEGVSDQNYFASNVLIGTTTAAGKLHVVGLNNNVAFVAQDDAGQDILRAEEIAGARVVKIGTLTLPAATGDIEHTATTGDTDGGFATAAGHITLLAQGTSKNINLNATGTVVVTNGLTTDNTNTNFVTIDGSGNLEKTVLSGAIGSGTFTPTLTNGANVAASTAYSCQYMQVGGTVTVSGRVDIDPTSVATLTSLDMSIPVTSAFSAQNNCGGTGGNTLSVSADASTGTIYANAANDRVTLDFVTGTDVANRGWFFTYTYTILAP